MTLAEILRQFAKLRVLLVGDVCLDRWCRYDPALALPSAETGLPRVAVVHTDVTPGAAGTIANNLIALGAGEVSVLGAVGADGNGFELRAAMRQNRIAGDLLVEHEAIATFTYTKLINEQTGVEDLPRVDVINREDLPGEVEKEVAARLRKYGSAFDVIIVSDQAETPRGGVVTAAVRDALADLAAADPTKVVWVDSRRRATLFRRVMLKINEQEASEACATLGDAAGYEALREHTSSPLLLVTCGKEGVTLLSPDAERQTIPTVPVAQPVDICGAGDSFSAGGALTYAVTRSAEIAARVGNLVASVTIMKPGTGNASPVEVLAAAERLVTA